jgi:hypothetical protein
MGQDIRPDKNKINPASFRTTAPRRGGRERTAPVSQGQGRTRGASRTQTLDELMARAQERHRTAEQAQGVRPPREYAVEVTGADTEECFRLHVREGTKEIAIPLHATQVYELWYLLAEACGKWQLAATGVAPLGTTTHKEALLGLSVRVLHKGPHDCIRVTVNPKAAPDRVLVLHIQEVAALQSAVADAYRRWQADMLAAVLNFPSEAV